jgi:hypothetical protein
MIWIVLLALHLLIQTLPLSNQPHPPVAKVEEISVKNSYSSSTRNQMSAPAKSSGSFVRPTYWSSKSRSISPLKEISTNWKSDSISSLRQKQAVGDSSRKSRRRHLTALQGCGQNWFKIFNLLLKAKKLFHF